MILLNFKEGLFVNVGMCVFKVGLLSNNIQYNSLYFKAGGNINILMPRQCYFKINIRAAKLLK